MQQLELRINEAKFESKDDGLKVSGYVNKTDQWSQTLGQRKKFVERIRPGAFRKALQNGNEINFLAEHDNAKVLSSTKNGSLILREDDEGLYMEATIAPTSWGRDYHTLIKEGIIQNMSFGMSVLKDSWKKLNDGIYERSITDLALFEVSAVRNPAYVQSTIQATRSIEIIEEPQINISEETQMPEKVNLDKYRDKLASFDKVTSNKTENRNQKNITQNQEKRALEQFLRNERGEERAMLAGSGAGSMLVPTHIHEEVVLKAHETAPLFARTRNFTPVNGSLEILADDDMGRAASFIGEGLNLTPDDFTMKKVRLDQKRVGTAIEISEQTINDSGIDIVNYATNLVGRRYGQTVDENILIGTGDANKQFQGILIDSPTNTIETTTVADLQTINMDKLLDFYNSLHPDFHGDSIWVMSRKAFNYIVKLKQSNGDLHMLPDIKENVPYDLLGHPVFISEAMDDLDKNPSKKLIVFGNFFEGYATMTKKGAKLRHITDDTTQALRGSQLIMLDGYMDGKILNPQAFKTMAVTNI